MSLNTVYDRGEAPGRSAQREAVAQWVHGYREGRLSLPDPLTGDEIFQRPVECYAEHAGQMHLVAHIDQHVMGKISVKLLGEARIRSLGRRSHVNDSIANISAKIRQLEKELRTDQGPVMAETQKRIEQSQEELAKLPEANAAPWFVWTVSPQVARFYINERVPGLRTLPLEPNQRSQMLLDVLIALPRLEDDCLVTEWRDGLRDRIDDEATAVPTESLRLFLPQVPRIPGDADQNKIVQIIEADLNYQLLHTMLFKLLMSHEAMTRVLDFNSMVQDIFRDGDPALGRIATHMVSSLNDEQSQMLDEERVRCLALFVPRDVP